MGLAGGVGLVASDGPGVVDRTWRLDALRTVAQDVAGNAMALGPVMERHGGVLSTGLPEIGAPQGWLDEDGGAGVIIGVGLPGAPASVAVGDEAVLLVGIVPLRRDEPALVVEGCGGARQQIAQALRHLSAADLTSPEHPGVLPRP